jgi:hypothetical protein
VPVKVAYVPVKVAYVPVKVAFDPCQKHPYIYYKNIGLCKIAKALCKPGLLKAREQR